MISAAGSMFDDMRHAIRALLRAPQFTLAAVVTLALGIGMNTAIFSVVNAVLLRPLPYPGAERLLWMAETGEVSNRFVSYANFKDWRDSNESFAAISTVRSWPFTLTGTGEPRGLAAQMVAPGFFKVLGAEPALGRVFTADDESAGSLVTVISDAFWRSSLGADPAAVGRTIALDDKAFQVIGIMPPGFEYQSPSPLWVLVGGGWSSGNWNERDVRMAGYVIGRLKPGVTIAQARSDMSRISEGLIQQYPVANAGNHRIEMTSLADSITRDARPLLLSLLGAVGLVLLIACANVANLLLARAVTRHKEMAVRIALGASQARIVRQLLAESIPLSLAGGLAGLLVAWWTIDLLLRLAPPSIPRLEGLSIDWRVLGFTLVISLSIGFIFGLSPAGQISRKDLNSAMRANSPTGTGPRGDAWRSGLVVIEMALALILLGGCGLMIRSMVRLLDSNPGFDPSEVVTMKLVVPSTRYGNKSQTAVLYRELLERVAALPGVEHASISNNLPGIEDGWQTDIFPEGHQRLAPGELINVDWSIVTEDYFATMKIPVLRGRTFTDAEVQNGSPVVLVDESLAREFWPQGDAVGKHILYDSPDRHEIIGIVKSTSVFGSEVRPRIKIYTPVGRSYLTKAVLSIRGPANLSRNLSDSVTAETRAVDSSLPVWDVADLDELLSRQVSPRRFGTALVTIFAGLALILAAIGIFGVASYSVAQRTGEIGVRMALGAARSDISKMILWQGLKQASIGVLLGLGGWLALAKSVKSLLYGIGAADPATLIAAAALMALTALAACYIPAKRAAELDPLAALRHE
ncbi:MAG TPA: ABC transporter permease [Blastocatellia bacterium]|nr:ABC transporter permease [Blastocatellia bacterium]